jgi:hypothetical protein
MTVMAARSVFVTPAEVEAARLLSEIERDNGLEPTPGVDRIANPDRVEISKPVKKASPPLQQASGVMVGTQRREPAPDYAWAPKDVSVSIEGSRYADLARVMLATSYVNVSSPNDLRAIDKWFHGFDDVHGPQSGKLITPFNRSGMPSAFYHAVEKFAQTSTVLIFDNLGDRLDSPWQAFQSRVYFLVTFHRGSAEEDFFHGKGSREPSHLEITELVVRLPEQLEK